MPIQTKANKAELLTHFLDLKCQIGRIVLELEKDKPNLSEFDQEFISDYTLEMFGVDIDLSSIV